MSDVLMSATDMQRRGLFTWEGLFYAAPLGVLFLVESFAFKVIQVTYATDVLSIPAAFGAAAPDAAFAIFTAVAAALGFSRRGFKTRLFTGIAFYLVVGAALFVNAFSHGYFLATGSHLSSSTIDYWLGNMDISNRIMATEATAGRLLILGVQLALVVACVVVPRLPRITAWIRGKAEMTPKTARTVAIASAVVFVVLVVLPPPSGRAMGVARCVPVAIAWGFVEEGLLAAGDVDVRDEDRLDGRLAFRSRPGAPRPNIVFLIFESLNWKSSDVYFPGKGTTPFLAELAKKSLVVEHQYSIVPHTTKAIMPILCGIYPYMEQKALETTPGILPRRCAAHILADQGYATAFFQPAYNFEKRDVLVANMGFDTFRGVKDMPRRGFEKVSYFGNEDKMMIGPSMDWVDSLGDQPFFLTYLTLSTHHNYVTPQTFPYKRFDVKDKDQENYLNAVRYIDDTIREIYAEFEKRGLLENTVFVMMGDHGEAFAEHGRRQHDLIMWEEGLHTAALIHAPGMFEEAGVIDGMRSNLDFVPTVADILDLELSEGGFIGTSLLEPVPDDRKLYHGCWFNKECLAVHDGQIKTIFHYGSQPMEVYDNYADPFELENLAGTGEYDQRFLDAKKEEMLRWKKSVDQQYEDWKRELREGQVTDQAPRLARKIEATFGDAIEIIGYEAPRRAEAGQSVRLRYGFRCAKKPPPDARLFVHVLHPDGMINADHVPASGSHPISKWEPGQFVLDEHTVHLPAKWSAGKVRVYLGFWDRRSGKRIPAEGEGVDGEKRLLVTELDISARRGSRRVSASEIRSKLGDWVGFERPAFEEEVGAVFGDKLELVGVSPERMDVMLAGTVEMTYVFKALGDVPRNWKMVVRLVKDDGFQIKGDHVPIRGLYPLKYWREGEYVVDKHKIHIDMYRSKVGSYTAWLGFRSGSRIVPVTGSGEFDSQGRVKLGTVTIAPRDARQ